MNVPQTNVVRLMRLLDDVKSEQHCITRQVASSSFLHVLPVCNFTIKRMDFSCTSSSARCLGIKRRVSPHTEQVRTIVMFR